MDDASQLKVVEVVARSTASSLTRDRQRVDDAVQAAIEAWERKVLSGDVVANLAAWVRRVVANEVRSRRAGKGSLEDVSALCEEVVGEERLPSPVRDLEEELAVRRSCLTARQAQVLDLVWRSRASFHEAARLLRTDRANVRRIFERALERLRNHGSDATPPL